MPVGEIGLRSCAGRACTSARSRANGLQRPADGEHQQAGGRDHQRHVPRERLPHQRTGKRLPRLQRFGDLDHDALRPAVPCERPIEDARVGADSHRLAEVAGVAELRLPGHEGPRWRRQVGVADLDQAVLGGDAIEHAPAGGELEELESTVRQLDAEAAARGGDVGVHGLDRAQKRTVVGGIGGVERGAPGRPEFSADDQQKAGKQHQQQRTAQAQGVPGIEVQAPPSAALSST